MSATSASLHAAGVPLHDERFAATYDAHGEGLAAYVHDAVHARADDVVG